MDDDARLVIQFPPEMGGLPEVELDVEDLAAWQVAPMGGQVGFISPLIGEVGARCLGPG